MKYKLYQRDKKSQLQEYPGIFMGYDIFGGYTIIDEEMANYIKLKYPDAHLSPTMKENPEYGV